MQLTANSKSNKNSNSIRRCHIVGHDQRRFPNAPTSSVSSPSSVFVLQSSRLLSMPIWANDNLQNDFGCIIYADAATAASSQLESGNLATWLTGNWQHLASWLLRRTPMHIQCHNPNGILMLNAYSPDCCRRRLTADSQITRFSGNDLHYLLYYPACR